MNVTKSAISQQLVKLEKDGYIFRRQHAEDKRAFSVELGRKACYTKKKWMYIWSKFLKSIMQVYHLKN